MEKVPSRRALDHFPRESLDLERYAAHVLLDSRIESSGLEGASLPHILHHLISFIDSEINTLKESLLAELKQCQKWSEELKAGYVRLVAKNISQTAQGLSFGESILIPGGWRRNPSGHTMLYRLTKQGAFKYSLTIINTGSGIGYHQKLQGIKESKILLAYNFSEIPSEDLFFGGDRSGFFEALLFLQSTPQKADFDPRVIYEGILGRLSPYRNDSELGKYPQLFITPQRGGTCSLRSAESYIRLMYCLNGQSLQSYKTFILCWKKKALEGYLAYARSQKNPLEPTLTFLKDLKCEFAHTLRKDNCDISPCDRNILAEVESFLRASNNKVVQEDAFDPVYFLDASKLQSNPLHLVNLRATRRWNSPITLLSFPKITARNVNSHAQALLETINKIGDDSTFSRLFILNQIDHFAMQVSLDRADWKNAEAFETIYQLLETYYRGSIQKQRAISPRQATTIFTLYYSLWAMIPHYADYSKQFRNRAFAYPKQVRDLVLRLSPPKNLFHSIDNNVFFLIMSPSDQHRFAEVRKAFGTWESASSLSIFKSPLAQDKIIPNKQDDEIIFYKDYCALLSEEFKRGFKYQFKYQVSAEYEEQALLAAKDDYWHTSFPLFAQLRCAHDWIEDLTQHRRRGENYGFYLKEGENSLKVYRDSKSHPCYFQQAFGYSEARLPNTLQQALRFPSLLTKSWDYLDQFQTTCIEEARALEHQSSLDELSSEDMFFLRECASLATDAALAPYHLLTLYEQHASLLQEQTHRTLLLTQLFKTQTCGKNRLQETIDSDSYGITEKICSFAKTLETLAFQAGDEPDHELFLYATYILSSASQYYITLPESLKSLLQHQLKQLNQGLVAVQKEGIHEDIARSYHLHKLYALTNITLDDSNLAEAFGHYFALCTFRVPKDHPNLLMEISAIAKIHDQLDKLRLQDEDFLREMVVSIVTATKFEGVIGDAMFLEHIRLNPASPILTCRDMQGSELEIHCATGNIFHRGELLKRSGDFNKETKEYETLFGSRTYPVFSTGDTQYLDHSAGMFRRQGKQIAFLPKGYTDWVIYCHAQDMDGSIPLFLRAGYRHFYDPKMDRWTFIKGKDYKQFDVSFTWKRSEQRITSHDQNVYCSPIKCSELERIERADCIVKRSGHGRCYIELPRYNLTFVVEERKLKWTTNQKYYLVENQLPPETLCVQEQSLLLQDDQGKRILLVPRFPIEAERGFSKKGKIIFPKDEKEPNFDWGVGLPQAQYSCFNLSSSEAEISKLTPNCIEDILTLAYYSLQDREFERFNTLLKAISPCDTLSEECVEILQWILFYGESQKHLSPEVHVSILRAGILFLYMGEKSNKKLVLSEEIECKITDCAQTYLKVRTHINHHLRLTQDEERYISQYITGVFDLHLKIHENDFSPSTVETIGFSINIPPQRSQIFWGYLKPSTSSLPSSIKKMENSTDAFFSVYQSIVTGDFDLKTIETRLLIQNSLGVSHDYFKLALCCLEAKRQGRVLPHLPAVDFWKHVYEIEKRWSTDQTNKLKQDYSQRGDEWNRKLNNAIHGISYTITPSNIPIETDALGQAFFKMRKENNFPSYYPVDFSEHIKEINPIWEIAGLARKDCSSPLVESRTIQIFAGSNKDPEYHCIQTEIAQMNQEIQEGAKRLAERCRMEKIGRSYGDLADLMETLKEQLSTYQHKMKAVQEELLERVNLPLHQINTTLTKEQIKEIEGTRPKITIEQLEEIALWGDRTPEVFQRVSKKCPRLKEQDFQQEIWKSLAHFEEQAVTCMALEQALAACKKLLSEHATDQKNHFVDLALALEMHLKNLGEDEQLSYLQMLIFARRSKIIPRNDQLEDLQKLSNGPCILQKIMGGGKTSVIAALWAFRQARFTDQLPTLFAEGSLYRSLADNLKKGQHTALGQEVFTIDHLRSELDLQHLRKIVSDLREGQKKKRVLVMRAEMLQSLDLELQKLSVEGCPEDQDKREVLREILNFFKTHVNALGDEIDLLLRADFEVNVPTGGKAMLTPARIDLVREIFTYLASNKDLGIQQGTQGLRSEGELQKIFEDLAHKIVDYPGLCLRNSDSEVKQAFRAFLVGEKGGPIPGVLREYVEHLRGSAGAKDREASELIPLASHIVADILPHLFKQSPGLHFGRANQLASPGKVVPYIGVDTPSNREFGYHYEALCKHFFTAIVKKLEPLQVSLLFNHFMSEGKREVSVNKCLLQATAAAKEFKELTGQEISTFQLGRDLNAVIEYVESDLSKLLHIEAETAFRYVGFYSEYYHSSAQALPNLVSSPLKGMTGTPWNFDGYHLDIQKLSPDRGAEGQILYTLLEREEETQFHTIKQLQLEKLMQKIKEMGTFPDAILDMGALFKEYSTEETSREYLCAALEKKGGQKEAVLFFHRLAGEQTADRLAIGRFVGNNWSIEFLANNREESLKVKGLCPEQCLVFFDQRHTTGTDIPLPLQAHAVITASETIETRTLLQTVMRLRKFCSSQTANFLLHQEFYDQLSQQNKHVSIKNLLSLACRNLALKKSESLFRSLKQQIDEVFIEKYRQCMRRNDVDPLISKIYGPLIRSGLFDHPYQQFFNDCTMEDPLNLLQAYRRYQLKVFDNQRQGRLEEDYREIERLTLQVIQRAKEKGDRFLQLVPSRQNIQGIEVEVEIEQEQDIELEQEHEVAQELINELQRYQLTPRIREAQHQPWWNLEAPEQSLHQFIEAIRSQGQKHPAALLSAPEVLKKVHYASERRFDQIFPDNIKLTAAMQRSYDSFLPVFHSSQKIAESILIVENGQELIFTLLSIGEASFFLQYAKEMEGVWLVNSNGKLYTKSSSVLDLKEREDLCEGLVMTNIFLGRAAAIEEIPEGAVYVQMWIEGGEGNEKDRKDYLTLRSLNRPVIDQCSRFINILAPQTVQGALNAQALSKDEIQSLENSKQIFQLTNAEIQHICPKQVPFIRNKSIALLTQPELIRAVPIKKLVHLTKDQIPHLSKEQALALQESESIKLLSREVIKEISLEDLLSHEEFTYHLTDQQMHYVKEEYPDQSLTLEDWRNQPFKNRLNLSIFLCEKDVQLLDIGEIPNIHQSLLKHLTKEQVIKLKAEQVKRLPKEKVFLLENEQLQYLVEQQIPAVAVERVEHLVDKQLCYLTKEQVIKLDEIHIIRLPAGRVIQFLENRQIKYLERREQIESVLPDKVAFLAIKQLKYLKGRHQIERISIIKSAIFLNNDQFKDMNRLQQITFLFSRLLIFLALTKISLVACEYIINRKKIEQTSPKIIVQKILCRG